MKKKIFLLTVAVSLLCIALGAGCGGTKETPLDGNVEKELVDLLDLRIEDERLCWNSVVNATSYTLYINETQVKEFTAEEELFYEYDKTENDYTAKLTVKGEKLTNFEASVQYSVKKLATKDPEVFANSVRFQPQNSRIFFRILPSAEWREVNDGNYINFNSYEKGSTVEYEYYVEGTGYDADARTYYTDSAVRKNSIKIKEQLPNVRLSAEGKAVSWEAVAGAASYTVIEDGEARVVSDTSVLLSEKIGSHVVYVYANPQDDETYAPSDKACLEYETQKQSVDLFTVNGETVTFDKTAADVLYYKTGDRWAKAASSVLDKQNLTVKLASYYDQAAGIYYLESNPLTFQKGEKLEVSFDKEGYLHFENGGSAYEFKLYSEAEAAPDDYSVSFASEYYIGNCLPGNTYRFESKFLNRIVRGENEDNYYEYAAEELTFYALAAPDLKIRNEKVVWTIDEHAEKYVYGTEEGALNTAVTESFAAEETVEKYYMQAIGSDEGRVLNSPVAVVDATKWSLTIEQLEATYAFDSERKTNGAATGSSSIEAVFDAENNAMKITPKENNKAVLISVEEFTLNAGDKIVVRALSAINVGFRVNEKWRITLQEAGGTAFKNYIWPVTEPTDVNSIEIMPYTSQGELYVQSIRVVRKQNLTAERLEAGFGFDSEEALWNVSWDSGKFDVAYDETQSAVKIAPKEASQAVSVHVEEFTLNAGDKIVVCALSAINVGFRVNGTWKMTLQEAGGTAFKNYVWTATETTIVTGMDIMPYTSKGELYVQSIQVERRPNLTAEQLEAGFDFDSEEALGVVSWPEKYTVTYDETQKNAVKISTTDPTQTVSVFVEEFTLNAGDQIVVRALSAVNVGLFINGEWKKDLTIDGTEFTESVWEAEETITVTGMGIKLNSRSAAIYVQSIKVVRA